MEFFGNCSTADDATAFQYAHFQASASQIKSTNKPVMAAANNNRIIGRFGHNLLSCRAVWLRSQNSD
jgi:hypothetical protein